MKRLYIKLFHGRVHPNEDLEDWGFGGPALGPLDCVCSTYGTFRYIYENSALGVGNAFALGDDREENDLNYTGDLVAHGGFFYGDFTVLTMTDQEARRLNNEWLTETRRKQLSRQVQWSPAATADEGQPSSTSTNAADGGAV
jgi:hypothetical protein